MLPLELTKEPVRKLVVLKTVTTAGGTMADTTVRCWALLCSAQTPELNVQLSSPLLIEETER